MKQKMVNSMSIFVVCLLALGIAIPAAAATQLIVLISKNSDGVQANADSNSASISADGRTIAFSSSATNLSTTCNDGFLSYIFVHDLDNDRIVCVSINSEGVSGNDDSIMPSISADGRYVAFVSYASLTENDTNLWLSDIYVYDRQESEIILVSVNNSGQVGDSSSFDPSISGDGRYVAFWSLAANLDSNLADTNGKQDIFVRDLVERTTVRISVPDSHSESNGHSGSPMISEDGRFVAFSSSATNLLPGVDNGYTQIYVHNMAKHTNTHISKSSSGEIGIGLSDYPSISATGRYVSFESNASNLVSGDTNIKRDIFLHDRSTNETTRVSVASNGEQANGNSAHSAISADGRFVTFDSAANNLDPIDNNFYEDVFVHDRMTGATRLISISLDGRPGNGDSNNPSISADGRQITFRSGADNLVPDHKGAYLNIFLYVTLDQVFVPMILR